MPCRWEDGGLIIVGFLRLKVRGRRRRAPGCMESDAVGLRDWSRKLSRKSKMTCMDDLQAFRKKMRALGVTEISLNTNAPPPLSPEDWQEFVIVILLIHIKTKKVLFQILGNN